MKLVVAAIAALAVALPASAAQAPTIVVSPSVIGRVATPIVIQGSVPGAGAGTEVKIEAMGCGETFFRLFGLTHTTAGGAWRWEPSGWSAYIRTNTRFRARANNAVSSTVMLRRRVPVDLTRVPASRKFRASVFSEYVNLHGKRIRLERFSGGRWVLVRTAKLNRESYGTHAATFRVTTRGLQLRASIPESLVKACYAAGVSAIIKS